MRLDQQILEIRDAIRAGRFVNEAAVCNGIVMPLLYALEWPIFDPQIVAPQFTLEGRRVDYALCHPRNRAVVFVEVKQTGKSEGADRQLFEYAFHTGVPMALLTDGQEWHFYLPAEQGHYQDRRVYKLDLVERDVEECVHLFRRYLSYPAVCSGEAVANARNDYQSVRRRREAEDALPHAWKELVGEPSEVLIELLADQVENLCGYRPEPDTVARFLSEKISLTSPIASPPPQRPRPRSPQPEEVRASPPAGVGEMTRTGFELRGRFVPARNGRDVLIQVLQEFGRADASFLQRFAALPKHGKRRRWVASDRKDLYPGRPDLARDHSYELSPGWWAGTNYGVAQMTQIIERACEVAGVSFGRDLRIKLD